MSREKNILRNYLLYFLCLFSLFIVGISNVFGLTVSELRMYFTDYSGTMYNTNSTAINQWGGYNVTYINHWFNGGYNFDKPNSMYAFFNSGQGCSNKNCILNGVVVANTDVTYNSNVLSSLKVQIETNGHYKSCAVVGLSMQYNFYSYLNFQCTGYDLNSGFNIVLTYFDTPSTVNVMYGLALQDFTLQDTATTDDVIVNDNRNTQNIINNNNQNTQNIINNNNQNTQDIIDSNNQNAQDIINNQNQNNQNMIESQKVCNIIDYTDIIATRKFLNSSGNVVDATKDYYGITDYIDITNSTIEKFDNPVATSTPVYFCFYNDNKVKISCYDIASTSSFNIPNNARYLRSTMRDNKPQFKICKDGNQALDDSINGLNDNLNNDDTTGAESEASEFFSSFTTNTFGLTSIITAPLNLIQSLTSSTCSELHLPLPYLNNKYLDLPCMTSIYQTHFGAFFTIYQTITYGIIAYWVCVRIFNQVKDFKNPEHDEIEVVDL